MISGSMIQIAIIYLFNILEYILLAWVLLSWFIRDPNHPLMRFLGIFIDPIIVPIQALMNKIGLNTGFLDFSPVFAIILLRILRVVAITLVSLIM